MFWITENYFLFVGLFSLAESWTRKSGTAAALVEILNFSIHLSPAQTK